MTATDSHVVLVARALHDPGAARALLELASRVGLDLDRPVHAAFLDGQEPALHRVMDDCMLQGAVEVVLVVAHVPADSYLSTWAVKAVAHWRDLRAVPEGELPRILVAGPLVERAELSEAVRAVLASARPVRAASPEAFRSPSWSLLPDAPVHLLVCRGPRCSAYGSGEVVRAVQDELASAAGYDDVLVATVGCLAPCNVGPLVVEHPGPVWHRQVDAESARSIASQAVTRARAMRGGSASSPGSAPDPDPMSDPDPRLRPGAQRISSHIVN